MTTAVEVGSLQRVREGARALSGGELVSGVLDAFRKHNLLVAAGGMAFRFLLAVIPVTLFVVGLMGVLGFDEVWRNDVAPDVRASVSAPAFKLIDDAVTHVLSRQQAFWVTAGALIAVWEGSGVVRAATQVLNRVYDVKDERRPLVERFGLSFAIAIGAGLCLLAALASVRLGPLLLDDAIGTVLGFVVRWGVAVVLLLLAVGLIVRSAPDLERPFHWVTFGAVLVVGGWALMSLGFGLYLTQIADYASIFGNLATVFVLLEYLFLGAIVFVGGLVVDALVEEAG